MAEEQRLMTRSDMPRGRRGRNISAGGENQRREKDGGEQNMRNRKAKRRNGAEWRK